MQPWVTAKHNFVSLKYNSMMFLFLSRPYYLLDILRVVHWELERRYVAAMTKGSGSFRDNRSARHAYVCVCVHECVHECLPINSNLHQLTL